MFTAGTQTSDTTVIITICCVSDTVSRSGVYCAVSNALEQCKTEGVVDVFQVTKAVRMQRPGAVTTLVITISLNSNINSISSIH